VILGARRVGGVEQTEMVTLGGRLPRSPSLPLVHMWVWVGVGGWGRVRSGQVGRATLGRRGSVGARSGLRTGETFWRQLRIARIWLWMGFSRRLERHMYCTCAAPPPHLVADQETTAREKVPEVLHQATHRISPLGTRGEVPPRGRREIEFTPLQPRGDGPDGSQQPG